MSEVVIHAENLGKLYHIGEHQRYKTLRDAITNTFAAPFRKINQGSKSKDETPDYIWALKNVSFEIKKGEVIGIIGRNGAGKSTLLKILSRITLPTEGYAQVQGRMGSLLEVGTGFHPELTGRDNIYLNGVILGMKKAEINRKFNEIVAFAEVEKFIDAPLKHYSSGMHVRLAFAVAAYLEPEILIVDEVLAVGDAAFQKKCLDKMNDVNKEGKTVLFVSHNMQAIRQLCTRTILLQSGRLIIDDESSKVIEHYLQGSHSQVGDIERIKEIIQNLPPDPIFKLEGISLVQNNKPVGQIIENGKPIEIEIGYHVFEKVTGLRIYFELCDDQDMVLFRSFHDEDNDGIPLVEPGYYISKTVIPADLLAPIRYELRIYASIFNGRNLFPNYIPIPLYVERTGRANRAYLTDPIRGRLAPFLLWETKKI